MRKLFTLAIAVTAALALVLSGCGDDDERGSSESTTTTSESVSGTIIVSAASSLTDAFTTIKHNFVRANPEASITINFGSSEALATQIQEGAPVDVAAFADTTPMTTLDDAGLLAAGPEIFAKNRLFIVTKPGNPANISGLAELGSAGIISLCVDTAPCGEFANQVLADAGVTIPESSITRGTDVKATLTSVTEGDAVAGIVYVTDAQAVADQVAGVEIPEDENVVASYPIAVVTATAQSELAEAFEAYVLSEEGQAVLKEVGFLAP
ncbi:MAG TPA: molybdate ABC transporter substrate-binding protein [Microthrixaceae bacterium]|nr:molybdate ABC transporter substrate-binding protein [Microthrixaceae bacterium]